MVEYDESLREILCKNKISYPIIGEIIKIISVFKIGQPNCQEKLLDLINRLKLENNVGCIFTIPSGRRDSKSFVLFTEIESSGIHRILKLRSFI